MKIQKSKLKNWYRKGNKAFCGIPVSNTNAVGFCNFCGHYGRMSEAMMKKHKCIEKNCKYFTKFSGNPYWVKKTIINVLKKYNKNNGAGYIDINGNKLKTNDFNEVFTIYMNEYKLNKRKPSIEYVKCSESTEGIA